MRIFGHRSKKLEDQRQTVRATFSNERVVNEHFVPASGLELDRYIEAGDLTAVHHIIRYTWAREVMPKFATGSGVLDLGCGSGYGTFMLAEANPNVEFLGVDYDPSAILEASQAFSLDNLRFKVGDPASWDDSIGSRRFSLVTCFDVLEHVEHRDLLLEGLCRHLDHGGTLLFSTPCGSANNVLKPEWVHHRIEFSAASLFDLLRRYFASISRPEEPTFPGRHVFEGLHRKGIDYLLHLNPVICQGPIVPANPYRGL